MEIDYWDKKKTIGFPLGYCDDNHIYKHHHMERVMIRKNI
jgi:hypothetical protein